MAETVTDELDAIVTHYAQMDHELNRLNQGGSRIEFARTQELLRRFLPPAPAAILDIGGGPGTYSGWLSELAYRVPGFSLRSVSSRLKLLRGGLITPSPSGLAMPVSYRRETGRLTPRYSWGL